MNSKVSIIIPVYNVEKHLGQCLDSVINQTLKEIEIICVNDGSTDNSPQILEEYSKKDKRIKLINHKQNKGLGSTRNIGMEHATGEYIGFVDADDWVDVSMFEKLYKNAISYNSDIVMCPIHIFDDNIKEFKYEPYFTLECFDKRFDNCIFNHKDTKDFLFHISVTVWNKIYKTEFLDNNNVKFPEGLIFEDNPFFYETYLKATNISLIREFLYYYRRNRTGSIMSTMNERFFDVIKVMDINKKKFVDTNNFDEYRMDILNFIIANLVYRFSQVDREHKQEFFGLIKKEFEILELKNDEISEINPSYINKYKNIMKSDSLTEFELLEQKLWLLNKIKRLELANDKLNHEKQFYENKINEITSSNSWNVTKPLRKIGNILRKDNPIVKKYLSQHRIISDSSQISEK